MNLGKAIAEGAPSAHSSKVVGDGKGNGAPDQSNLELILEELRDWEDQLRGADIDWDALDDVEIDEAPAEHLDLGDGP